MKTFRMATAFVILALVLALVPGAMAQDMTFGLSSEDYATLTAAGAATAAATSAEFTFDLDLNASNEGQTAVIDLQGTGLYGADSAGEPIFSLNLTGTIDDGSGTITPADMELRFVGGSAYFMLPAMMGPQWIELSPEDIEQSMSGLPLDPAALASGDMSGMEGMEGMGELMTALATLNPEQYVTITRNGEQFTTTADVTGLLASPGFAQFMMMAASANGSAADVDVAELQAVSAQLPTALEGTTFTLDQYVGADNMINRMVLDLNLAIDPAAIGETGDAVNLALVFDVNLSGFNGSYTVEAPADAMPLSQLMGGAS